MSVDCPRSVAGTPSRGSRVAPARVCILLVEARRLTRELVCSLLVSAAPDFKVLPVSSADNLSEADASRIGVTLLNIGDASLSDLRICTQMQIVEKRLPGVPMALLSDREDRTAVIGALDLGIRGYIPWRFGDRVIAEAIRLVHCGGTFVPASALKAAEASLAVTQGEAATHTIPAYSSWSSGEALSHLTPRQHQVLQFLCEGESNKKIAAAMNIHESTVKVHVREIMKKLGASNRTRAALLAKAYASIA